MMVVPKVLMVAVPKILKTLQYSKKYIQVYLQC